MTTKNSSNNSVSIDSNNTKSNAVISDVEENTSIKNESNNYDDPIFEHQCNEHDDCSKNEYCSEMNQCEKCYKSYDDDDILIEEKLDDIYKYYNTCEYNNNSINGNCNSCDKKPKAYVKHPSGYKFESTRDAEQSCNRAGYHLCTAGELEKFVKENTNKLKGYKWCPKGKNCEIRYVNPKNICYSGYLSSDIPKSDVNVGWFQAKKIKGCGKKINRWNKLRPIEPVGSHCCADKEEYDEIQNYFIQNDECNKKSTKKCNNDSNCMFDKKSKKCIKSIDFVDKYFCMANECSNANDDTNDCLNEKCHISIDILKNINNCKTDDNIVECLSQDNINICLTESKDKDRTESICKIPNKNINKQCSVDKNDKLDIIPILSNSEDKENSEFLNKNENNTFCKISKPKCTSFTNETTCEISGETLLCSLNNKSSKQCIVNGTYSSSCDLVDKNIEKTCITIDLPEQENGKLNICLYNKENNKENPIGVCDKFIPNSEVDENDTDDKNIDENDTDDKNIDEDKWIPPPEIVNPKWIPLDDDDRKINDDLKCYLQKCVDSNDITECLSDKCTTDKFNKFNKFNNLNKCNIDSNFYDCVSINDDTICRIRKTEGNSAYCKIPFNKIEKQSCSDEQNKELNMISYNIDYEKNEPHNKFLIKTKNDTYCKTTIPVCTLDSIKENTKCKYHKYELNHIICSSPDNPNDRCLLNRLPKRPRDCKLNDNTNEKCVKIDLSDGILRQCIYKENGVTKNCQKFTKKTDNKKSLDLFDCHNKHCKSDDNLKYLNGPKLYDCLNNKCKSNIHVLRKINDCTVNDKMTNFGFMINNNANNRDKFSLHYIRDEKSADNITEYACKIKYNNLNKCTPSSINWDNIENGDKNNIGGMLNTDEKIYKQQNDYCKIQKCTSNNTGICKSVTQSNNQTIQICNNNGQMCFKKS